MENKNLIIVNFSWFDNFLPQSHHQFWWVNVVSPGLHGNEVNEHVISSRVNNCKFARNATSQYCWNPAFSVTSKAFLFPGYPYIHNYLMSPSFCPYKIIVCNLTFPFEWTCIGNAIQFCHARSCSSENN